MTATRRTRMTALIALAACAALTAGGLLALSPSADARSSVAACSNSSLAITHTPTEGATGHGSFVLLFRNVSHHTCTIHGYPGLDALSASGHVLAHARRTLHGFAGGAGSVRTVTVTPGTFASATAEWMNFNPVTSGHCTFSKSVATTPANTTHTVHLAVSVSVCDLQIHPTVDGTSGNYRFALAQTLWIAGARVSSAAEGAYWSKAEAELKVNGSEYSPEIAELKQLIALPDADQTPTQNAEYRHDVRALDAFFGTPRLYL
jgi:Protein of unknown function (DUF4232)